MPEELSKYGWYYGREAEMLAQDRLKLRKEGRFSEADHLRKVAINQYGVEILDTKDSYMLQWWDHNRG